MTTYNWDLIERLLHEVQNGAGHSFTPRPYAEQHAAAKAAEGEPCLLYTSPSPRDS